MILTCTVLRGIYLRGNILLQIGKNPSLTVGTTYPEYFNGLLGKAKEKHKGIQKKKIRETDAKERERERELKICGAWIAQSV
jgi:hypothetical protein